MHRFLMLLCVLNSVYYIQCRCNSFEDIEIELEPKNGDAYYKKVNGCIGSITIDRETVRVIVREEYVPILKYGAVQNLPRVSEVEFMNCSTEIIEAGSFRNLPRLEEIIIKFSHTELIPRGVFNYLPSLEVLRLNTNEIKVIEDQAFAHIPKLRWLFVPENKIETWRSTWFTNSTSIEDLHFEDNIIRKIPKDAFKNLRKLTRVWFDNNEISLIEPGAFEGIRHLEYLGLKHNRLKTLESNIFPSQITIDTLYIDANHLNFLPNEVLNRISVTDISLEGNPWKCPCLDRVLYWINEKNGTVLNSKYCQESNVPTCVFPKTYSQTCIENVDEEVTQRYLKQVKEATKGLAVFMWENCVRFNEEALC